MTNFPIRWSITQTAASLANLLKDTGSCQLIGGGEQMFEGVSIDSRSVTSGQLFVALKGPNFDAHDFVSTALAQGAVAAIVSRPLKNVLIPQLVVADTRIALGRLAEAWRNQFDMPVIAITGSNGKTTVKEMLARILGKHCGDSNAVLATEGNLNNDFGVPLMLLRMNTHHRFTVLEMGMNHLGEINYLSKLAKPTVALVNNAGRAHIGELGSVEAIAEAKGEIFAGLNDNGTALINIDDSFCSYWKSLNTTRKVLTFGLSPKADVFGVPNGSLSITLQHSSPDAKQHAFAHLHVQGDHNVRNAMAASAAAHAVGVPIGTIALGLSDYHGMKGRLERKFGARGAQVIDDTYNANPDSMKAAIRVLAKVDGRRLLVLGDMGELGAYARQFHEEVGAYAKGHKIDEFFVIGKHVGDYAKGFGPATQDFEDMDELIAAVSREMEPSVCVLIKGSRSARMERVVERLVISKLNNTTNNSMIPTK